MTIIVMMGLTWIFGYFLLAPVNQAFQEAMQWLFTLFNVFQVTIFQDEITIYKIIIDQLIIDTNAYIQSKVCQHHLRTNHIFTKKHPMCVPQFSSQLKSGFQKKGMAPKYFSTHFSTSVSFSGL